MGRKKNRGCSLEILGLYALFLVALFFIHALNLGTVGIICVITICIAIIIGLIVIYEKDESKRRDKIESTNHPFAQSHTPNPFFTEQLVDDTIQHLEKEHQEKEAFKRVRFENIQRKYPFGYDEWYRNLPANKATDCIEWALKEEDEIKKLENAYLERKKKEEEDQKKQAEELPKKKEEEEFNERHDFFIKYTPSFSLNMLKKIKGTPYYYFFNYYPKSKFEYDLPDIDSRVRRFIWDFKDGKKDIADMVSTKIKRLIHENLDKYTFVCIPASSQVDNNRRYKKFMEQVCETTGMANGYNYVEIVEDGERIHLGGKKDVYYYCDRGFFKDRLVVVFDDIYTHGRHLNWMILNLYSAGAKVVLALFLGKTSNEIIRTHPWVTEQMIRNMSEYILIKTEEDEDNEEFLQLQEISKRLKSALIQEILKGGKFSFNLEERVKELKSIENLDNIDNRNNYFDDDGDDDEELIEVGQD